MGMDLYYMDLSAPCRSVYLLAKSLGIDMNLKVTDLMKGENMTPEFIKMNPQHIVPTLDDNGFYLWESRAILTYLATKYDSGKNFYPSDPQARAVVDQRLYFDMGTLYERFAKSVYPLMFEGGKSVDPEAVTKLKEALSWLNDFIGTAGHVAGDKQTVADFAIASTVASIEGTGVVNVSDYANVHSWLESQKRLPGYAEANDVGAKELGDLFKQALAKVA
ncbi:glutathione S-transferase 1-like [Pollicipes pollicipes]|uniref:glutathione S-transferase 1-like n=1 Tax=Pollicipes pollicipes TaxID=41117 RepID=UPI00188494D9|nr:glutathione S-transferase 1-like [Pollicipes pollicipes]